MINNAQKLLDEKCQKEITEINLTKLLYNNDKKGLEYSEEGELEIKDFPNLTEIKIDKVGDDYIEFVNINKITIANCPNLKKIDINTFIDNKELVITDCPELTDLDCSYNQLKNLDLSKLVDNNVGQTNRLKNLDCNSNQLTNLDVSNCSNLTELYCHNNSLIDITLPEKTENLKVLALLNNNFKRPALINEDWSTELSRRGVPLYNKDISFLKKYSNLEKLYLGNFTDHEDDFLKHYDEERDKTKIYNRFSGSLETLKDLKNLKVLDISNTDISIDSYYYFWHSFKSLPLPENLEEIYCSSQERPESKVKEIENRLKEKGSGFYFPNHRYIRTRSAQEWLNKNYLENGACKNKFDKDNYEEGKGKSIVEITKLDIKEWGLAGELDLSDFVNLKELDCSNNLLTDLHLSKNPNLVEINFSSNDLKSINLRENKILEKIHCRGNQLNSIDLNDFPNLVSLDVNDNKITSTKFLDSLPNKEKLEILKLGGNDYKKSVKRKQQSRKKAVVKHEKEEALDFLKPFTGLTELDISDCSFEGNLKPLKNMDRLKTINISSTDINGGLEYLPDSCQKLICVCDSDKPKKSDKIAESFRKYHADYQDNDYYDLAKWKSDIKNLLERSTDIQKDIKKFFSEWRKGGALDKLKNPKELEEQGKRLYYTKWMGRGVSVVSGILSLTSYPEIGGGIAVVYPFAEGIITESYQDDYENNERKWEEFTKSMKRFWNHYRELVDVLGPFEFCGESEIIKGKEFKPLWDKIKEVMVYTDLEKDNLKDEFAWDLKEKWDTPNKYGISRKKQWNKIGEWLVEINDKGKVSKIAKEEGTRQSNSQVGIINTNSKGKDKEIYENIQSESDDYVAIQVGEPDENTPLLKSQIEIPPKGNN